MFEEDRPATMQEAAREYARNVGVDSPEYEWINTPFDTWERNPFYQGLPGRHPEDDREPEEDDFPIFRFIQEDDPEPEDDGYPF